MNITLATKITIARIFLIIPTVAVYVAGMVLRADYEMYLALGITACVLFTILASTDFVDGAIARKTNTVSDLGKFLDPLADKVIIVVMLFLIVYFDDINLFAYDSLVVALLAGIIMSRELAIGVFRAIAAKKGVVLAADVYGKFKTIFLDASVAALMIAGLNTVMAYLGFIGFAIGSALAIYSGFNYIFKNKAVLAGGSEKKD